MSISSSTENIPHKERDWFQKLDSSFLDLRDKYGLLNKDIRSVKYNTHLLTEGVKLSRLNKNPVVSRRLSTFDDRTKAEEESKKEKIMDEDLHNILNKFNIINYKTALSSKINEANLKEQQILQSILLKLDKLNSSKQKQVNFFDLNNRFKNRKCTTNASVNKSKSSSPRNKTNRESQLNPLTISKRKDEEKHERKKIQLILRMNSNKIASEEELESRMSNKNINKNLFGNGGGFSFKRRKNGVNFCDDVSPRTYENNSIKSENDGCGGNGGELINSQSRNNVNLSNIFSFKYNNSSISNNYSYNSSNIYNRTKLKSGKKEDLKLILEKLTSAEIDNKIIEAHIKKDLKSPTEKNEGRKECEGYICDKSKKGGGNKRHGKSNRIRYLIQKQRNKNQFLENISQYRNLKSIEEVLFKSDDEIYRKIKEKIFKKFEKISEKLSKINSKSGSKNYQFLSQKLKEKSPGLKQGKAYEINENQRVFNYNHKGKTINLQKNPL